MEWEQERYALRRQLDAEQATRRHLEDELETLQEELKTKEQKFQDIFKLIHKQTESHKNTEEELKIKIENLECLLESEKEEHFLLVEKLTDEVKAERSAGKNNDGLFLTEMQELKDKNEKLEKDLMKLQNEFEQLFQDNSELVKRNVEMTEMKDELEQALLSKREEVTSYVERYNSLQEEAVLLKVENDTLKAAPQVHSQKGNSVFAEIDDNRRDLKKNLEQVSKKYYEMKKIVMSRNSEIRKLREERSLLQKKVCDVTSNYELQESLLINTYKMRIKDLEKRNEELMKDLRSCQSAPTDKVSNDFKSIDTMFVAKRKETEELKAKIDELSQAVLLQQESNLFLRKDLDTKTAEAAYERGEKIRLLTELAEMKNKE